jgi:hypothetical protein
LSGDTAVDVSGASGGWLLEFDALCENSNIRWG